MSSLKRSWTWLAGSRRTISSGPTVTELNHEKAVLNKVDILFKEINTRPRDAELIRCFQRAVARRKNMEVFLREEVYPSGTSA